MASYFLADVSAAAIIQAGDRRPGTSPLVAAIKRVLGSTCRLRGPRVYKGDRPTALVVSRELQDWEERWQAGAEVSPIRVWVYSLPTVKETPQNKSTVRRAKG